MRSVPIALALLMTGSIAALPLIARSRQGDVPPPSERFAIFGTCPDDGSAALLKTAIVRDFSSIDNSPEEKERGITINTSHVEYQTVACHDRGELFTSMVTGESRPDTAVALVTERGGVADARGQILFAARAGIPRLVIFANDVKLGDAEQKELSAVLRAAGFDGDKTPIIRGSALGALSGRFADERAIAALIASTHGVPPPDLKREKDKPFLMPVEDVLSVAGGTVVTGRIELGVVRTGDFVEIAGLGAEKLASTVTGIEMFRKILDTGEAGDNVGLLLRGIDKKDIRRGMVIAAPGTVTPHRKFKAQAYILTKEEGGRHTPFQNTRQMTAAIYTADVAADVTVFAKRTPQPGDVVEVEVTLIVPIAMDKGLRFAIREGGRTVGAGVVAEIIE